MAPSPVLRRASVVRSAFTLVELLAVIAIIGILAAIIIPTVGHVRSAARDDVGLSHLRQIGLAASLYAGEHHNCYPYSYKTGEYDFSLVLAAYIAPGSAKYGEGMAGSEIFQDPAATFPIGRLHYSAHPVLMPDFANGGPQFNRSRLQRPGETVLVADGAQPLSGDVHASFWAADGGGSWTPFTGSAADGQPINPGPDTDTDSSAGHVRFRAAGDSACKVVFADGHVRMLKKDQFLRRYIRLEP